MLAASVTDWISAVSAAALGVAGLFVTLWQWHASGFRPRFTVLIDQRREAVQVQIANRGRAPGVIKTVALVQGDDPTKAEIDAEVRGFDDRFSPIMLPGLSPMTIVLRVPESAPKGVAFPEDAEVQIEWGAGKRTWLEPGGV